MMDTGITGGLPGLDVAAAAKTGAKGANQEDAKKGGFMDALTHVRDGGNERGKKADNRSADALLADAPDGDIPADGTVADPLASPLQTGKKKPIIDIQTLSARLGAGEEAGENPQADSLSGAEKRAARIAQELDAEARGAKRAGKQDNEPATDDVLPRKPAATTRAADAAVTEGDDDSAEAGDKAPLKDVMTLLGAEPPKHLTAAEAGVAGSLSKAQGKAEISTRDDIVDAPMGQKHDAAATDGLSDALGAEMPETDTSSPGQTFRLSRADGKGVSMDMVVGGSAGEDAKAETRSSGPVENVTVLESRRYLGLAQNSSAVIDTLSGDSEWNKAMQSSSALSNAAAMASTGRLVNTLKIQMHPISLGAVTATLRLNGDELSVELTVQNAAAYRQLNDDQKGIVEALRAQGFAVDQVSVTLVAAEKVDTGAGQGGQNGASGQQSAQDGSGGTASRKDDGNAQQQRTRQRSGSEEAAAESAPAVSGGARPGHVYI